MTCRSNDNPINPYQGEDRNVLPPFGLRLTCFMVAAALFMLLIPFAESPLHTHTSLDYDIFTTIARGWLDGHIPYTELFDSKGPYQFMLTAAGLALLPGKWGLWLLLTVNLGITLELLYRIGRQLSFCPGRIYTALTLCLLIAVGTIDAGATVEEWSLIPLTLPLLLVIRSVKTRIRPFSLGLVCGLCVGLLAFIRLNNAAIPAGALIGLAIILVRRGEFATLIKGVAAVLAGILIASAPMLIYFSLHNALDMMLFATFTYNIDYKLHWQSHEGNNTLLNASRLLCAPIAALAVWRHDRHNSLAAIIITVAVVVVCVFITGAGYCHYYTAIMPLIFIALGYTLRTPIWWKKLLVCAIIILPFANAIVRTIVYQYSALRNPNTRSEINLILETIPTQDLESVYQLNLDGHTDYLMATGRIPTGRYFTLQNEVAATSPRAAADIVEQFKLANPKWVISDGNMEQTVLSQFAPRYEMVASLNDGLILLRRMPSQTIGI